MKLFQLAWEDLLKGLVVSVLTAALSTLLPLIQAGSWPSKAQLIGGMTAGLTAGVAYLIKNFLTNSQGQLLKAEPNKADEVKA